MTKSIAVFDFILAIGLILAARQALFAKDPFQSIAFLISFGLLVALAWIRLGAPDVALAEASIGAGITGALLFDAVKQLAETESPTAKPPIPSVLQSARIFTSLMALAMILALWSLRLPLPGLLPDIQDQLRSSGVSHPITAVLLNFRAWDTWLELGVLFLASLAVLVIHRTENVAALPSLPVAPSPTLSWLARTMLPLLILIGGYLLWAGSRSPGGAFQSGAILGAAGVLLRLGGYNPLAKIANLPFRVVLTLGFFMFSTIGAAALLGGGNLLEYPKSWAGTLILAIEIAATASIALTLNVVYAGSRPGGGDDSS